MLVVTAFGGSAILRRGEPMTAEKQRANVRIAARALAPIAAEHQLVVGHGNGPQVGLLALQAAAYARVETYPLDALGAQTEGMIGYMLEQELGNLLPFERPLATVQTMVEVDPDDPAFKNPTRFIGPRTSGTRPSGSRATRAGCSNQTATSGAAWSRRRSQSVSSSCAPSSCCSSATRLSSRRAAAAFPRCMRKPRIASSRESSASSTRTWRRRCSRASWALTCS